MNNNILNLQDLENNPCTRVPICLCLDTSGSMNKVVRGDIEETGETIYSDGKSWSVVSGGVSAIDDLNEGINQFFETIKDDEVARYSAEICVITFGGEEAEVVSDFATVDQQKKSFAFTASGATYMGEAVNLALDCLEKRKQEYKSKGIDYFQPWLVLMTDGEPNSSPRELNEAISRSKKMVNNRKLTIFPIGVGPDANMSIIGEFSPKVTPKRLDETKYKEFFEWLSQSVVALSQSMPGEEMTFDYNKVYGWDKV